jgi:hypothetical protein
VTHVFTFDAVHTLDKNNKMTSNKYPFFFFLHLYPTFKMEIKNPQPITFRISNVKHSMIQGKM